MDGFKIAVFALILWGFQICIIQCRDCEIQPHFSGKIFSNADDFSLQEKCWFVPVSQGHYIHLKLNSLISSAACEDGYVRIIITGTGDEYKFCSTDKTKNPITAFGNTTVIHLAQFLETSSSFELEYSVKSIECINKNSFKCDDNSCISEEEVCDGVKDCKNGADEIGCGFKRNIISTGNKAMIKHNGPEFLIIHTESGMVFSYGLVYGLLVDIIQYKRLAASLFPLSNCLKNV
ncbi:hypothetical protein HNY73_021662 [Argiope bruennichi]|uniref:CUB domain-containing protein n=1 Tax=Argiope bruennichi TaxID=94029 RepID=A0A8T0DY86_ARGBR|nr:hypothetical protein HNY73_021662 [Argiope bruennichi]